MPKRRKSHGGKKKSKKELQWKSSSSEDVCGPDASLHASQEVDQYDELAALLIQKRSQKKKAASMKKRQLRLERGRYLFNDDDHISALPLELLMHIVDFIGDVRALLTCAYVSRYFRMVFTQENLWRLHCQAALPIKRHIVDAWAGGSAQATPLLVGGVDDDGDDGGPAVYSNPPMLDIPYKSMLKDSRSQWLQLYHTFCHPRAYRPIDVREDEMREHLDLRASNTLSHVRSLGLTDFELSYPLDPPSIECADLSGDWTVSFWMFIPGLTHAWSERNDRRVLLKLVEKPPPPLNRGDPPLHSEDHPQPEDFLASVEADTLAGNLYNDAIMHFFGRGVPRDRERAIALMRRAASHRGPIAPSRLAWGVSSSVSSKAEEFLARHGIPLEDDVFGTVSTTPECDGDEEGKDEPVLPHVEFVMPQTDNCVEILSTTRPNSLRRSAPLSNRFIHLFPDLAVKMFRWVRVTIVHRKEVTYAQTPESIYSLYYDDAAIGMTDKEFSYVWGGFDWDDVSNNRADVYVEKAGFYTRAMKPIEVATLALACTAPSMPHIKVHQDLFEEMIARITHGWHCSVCHGSRGPAHMCEFRSCNFILCESCRRRKQRDPQGVHLYTRKRKHARHPRTLRWSTWYWSDQRRMDGLHYLFDGDEEVAKRIAMEREQARTKVGGKKASKRSSIIDGRHVGW